jgi:uncharacterized protein
MPSRRERGGLLRRGLVNGLQPQEEGGAGAAGVKTPALYRATISHLRRGPAVHRFRHGSFLWLIDSDYPPRLPWPLRPLARFEPSDHADIRAVLADHGLTASRIVALTTPRTLGYVFNPLSVYWCYRGDGSLSARVAEVHNTRGQRHTYLLPPHGTPRLKKQLDVSPFHPKHGSYRMRISDPGPRLVVAVSLHPESGEPFTATLVGKRVPASALNLLRLLARYPWPGLRVALLIRFEAARLWAKRIPRARA